MNCADITELAPLYLARELPPVQARAFEMHLNVCRSCALEMEQQASIDARLRAAASEMPRTDDLDRKVMQQIGADSPPRRWLFAAAAAMFLLAAGSVWWIRLPRIYADAARDHRLEVVEHQPRRWRSGSAEVSALAVRFGLAGVDVAALAPAGYQLEHAKICGLDGEAALHLVYGNGLREVSLYVRRNGSKAASLVGEAVVGKEYLDSFQTQRFTAIVVDGASRADCLQFAQSAAAVL